MIDLQRPIPVLRPFRHCQCNHGASDPGPRSSGGMSLSFCGTDRRWWGHAPSGSAEIIVDNIKYSATEKPIRQNKTDVHMDYNGLKTIIIIIFI